jgi:hypothetical protein
MPAGRPSRPQPSSIRSRTRSVRDPPWRPSQETSSPGAVPLLETAEDISRVIDRAQRHFESPPLNLSFRATASPRTPMGSCVSCSPRRGGSLSAEHTHFAGAPAARLQDPRALDSWPLRGPRLLLSPCPRGVMPLGGSRHGSRELEQPGPAASDRRQRCSVP